MVNQKPKTSLYFSSVLALPADVAVMGGHLVVEEDDPTATVLLKFADGQWKLIHKVEEVVNGLARNTGLAEPRFGVLGRDGYFAEFSTEGLIRTIPIKSRDVTYLESIAFVEDTYYVCGGSRQVFALDRSGWRNIDDGIYVPFQGIVEHYLLSIDGFSRNDIYVSGNAGFVGHWNGESWQTIDVPTNTDLNAVCCATDQFICAAAAEHCSACRKMES